MYQFNRFYLLFALMIGLLLPAQDFLRSPEPLRKAPNDTIAGIKAQTFVEIKQAPIKALSGVLFSMDRESNLESVQQSSENTIPLAGQESKSKLIATLLLLVYLSGVVLFLIRYLYGIYNIVKKARNQEKVKRGTTTLVLMEEHVSPHSFMDYIFVNREDYHNGLISDQILKHEIAHLKQYHSLDVLFTELLKVIFWFNPVIYLYRRAILINHEYAADDQVIRDTDDPINYQEELLNAAEGHLAVNLASNLNFYLTKERFKMMTREVSRLRHASTKVLLVPILPILVLIYGLFVIDQDKERWTRVANVELTADTLYIFDQIQRLKFKDSEGNYYTGSHKLYDFRTGILSEETIYNNGTPLEKRTYNPLGGTFTRTNYQVENGMVRSVNYYFDGYLFFHHIFPHPDHGPEGKTRIYDKEGWLSYESNYLKNSQNFHGLVTKFNEEGDITAQEMYENGKLIEKIK